MVLSQAADGLARSAAHWLVLDGGTATAGGPPRELIRSAELARTGTVIHAVTHTAPDRAAGSSSGPPTPVTGTAAGSRRGAGMTGRARSRRAQPAPAWS